MVVFGEVKSPIWKKWNRGHTMKQTMELLTSLLIVLCSLQQMSCESSGNTKRAERKSNTVVTADTWTGPVTARRVRRTAEDVTAYTSEEAKELRDAHNDYRRQEGASGMEYMVRNESMLLEEMNLRVLLPHPNRPRGPFCEYYL